MASFAVMWMARPVRIPASAARHPMPRPRRPPPPPAAARWSAAVWDKQVNAQWRCRIWAVSSPVRRLARLRKLERWALLKNEWQYSERQLSCYLIIYVLCTVYNVWFFYSMQLFLKYLYICCSSWKISKPALMSSSAWRSSASWISSITLV